MISAPPRAWLFNDEFYSLEDQVLSVCPRSAPGTLAWSRTFLDVLTDVGFWKPGATAPAHAAFVTRPLVEIWDVTTRKFLSAIPPWGGSSWRWMRGCVDGARRRLYLTVERSYPKARKVVAFSIADPLQPLFVGEAWLVAGDSGLGGTVRYTEGVDGKRLLVVTQSATSTRVLDVTGPSGIGLMGADVLPYLAAARVSGRHLYGLRPVGEMGTATVSAWDLGALGDGTPWAEAGFQDMVVDGDVDAIAVRRRNGEDLILACAVNGWGSGGLGGALLSLRSDPGVSLSVDGTLQLSTPGPSPASMERIDLTSSQTHADLVLGRVYPPANGDQWTYYLGAYDASTPGQAPTLVSMAELHA